MRTWLAQAVETGAAASTPHMAMPSAIAGGVAALLGAVIVIAAKRRRRGKSDGKSGRNTWSFVGACLVAAGLAMVAYGVLGFGS